VSALKIGQKIDFDGDTGVQVMGDDGKPTGLNGTFLIGQIDGAQGRVRLLDVIHNKPVASTGAFKPDTGKVSTYKLVGPMYFLFFAGLAGVLAVLFIYVAGFYREQTHVRADSST